MKPQEIIDKYQHIKEFKDCLEFCSLDIEKKPVFINITQEDILLEFPDELKFQLQDLVKTWLTNQLIKNFEIK